MWRRTGLRGSRSRRTTGLRVSRWRSFVLSDLRWRRDLYLEGFDDGMDEEETGGRE